MPFKDRKISPYMFSPISSFPTTSASVCHMGNGSRSFHALLSSLLLFSFFLSPSYTATDTITSSQPIKDGETLISASQIFELGFFSAGKFGNRYVGIWYKKIPARKVVWVANPDNPLTDNSGVLSISSGGNLVLSNGEQTVIWSANASNPWEHDSNNTIAVLSDSGALTLKEMDSKTSILWESFNYPCNSLLQNMKIVVDLKTQEKIFLRSWRSEDDPKPGSFTFGLDSRKPAQAFIWNGTVPYWRSGQWDGRQFVGIPEMAETVYFDGATIVPDNQQQRLYFTFSVFNRSSISFFEIGSSGILSFMDWNDGKKVWVADYTAPGHECDVYGKCGTYGSCYRFDSPICSCLRGFQPKYEDKWRNGDWSGGCVRRIQLNCSSNSSSSSSNSSNEDGFLKMERVKLPDSGDWFGTDGQECERKCLKNCSCVAYAVVIGIGCLHWGGELMDIQQFSSSGVEIFIRLDSSELGRRKRTPVKFIILVSLLGAIILASFTGICWWRLVKQRGKKEKIQELDTSGETMEASNGSPMVNIIRDDVSHGEVPELLLFSFSKVAIATNNFSDANKLGEGGFGPVYKGKFKDGQEIAVKRLSKSSGQGLEEFKNEVIFISKLQHRNLVRLLGCCIEQEEKMLLYEYMPNKSLDSILFDPTKRAQLDWAKRFNIVEGVARGLLYLHRDSRLRIVHRDLKASNILLDDEMNPKISDFGMAWSSGGNQTLAKTNKVVGTLAYMAPEYAKEGRFSEKSDVFSFGVLLLEIVSGQRNSSFCYHDQSLNLMRYAWELWKDDKLSDLVDPSLGDSCSRFEVMRCIHVGLLCVQERALDRPTMSNIVFMLGSEITSIPVPMQPGFTIEGSPEQSSLPFLRNMYSVNNVSVSTMDGR